AQAERRLGDLAAATRRWLDLQRELARREAEAEVTPDRAAAADAVP
ncbi:hypothetical protein HKCCSP123_10725, partial [Rhodobacterales bacterium HKCCSP123]|nr:hypothetical protein [Rhodobacterales bacterium HKCCSP123]